MGTLNLPQSEDALVCHVSLLKRAECVRLVCAEDLQRGVEDAQDLLLDQLSDVHDWYFDLFSHHYTS